jgi:hypothetical protein
LMDVKAQLFMEGLIWLLDTVFCISRHARRSGFSLRSSQEHPLRISIQLLNFGLAEAPTNERCPWSSTYIGFNMMNPFTCFYGYVSVLTVQTIRCGGRYGWKRNTVIKFPMGSESTVSTHQNPENTLA